MKNRISSFFRSVSRSRLYYLVNIAGLSTAVAIALLAGLFVYRELTHDRFTRNLKNIYCLSVDGRGTNPFFLAESLKDQIPAVSSFTRVQLWDLKSNVLRYKDDPPADIDGIIRADTNFFEFFTFSFISGDPRSCLSRPESIVLTQYAAGKLFGREDPLGKTLSYNKGQMTLTVTAVVMDPPSNSSLRFNAVMSVNSLPVIYPPYREPGMFFWSFESFVALDGRKPDSSMNRLASEIFLQHIPEESVKEAQNIIKSKFEISMLPYAGIYFNREYQSSLRKGNKEQVYLFCLIGILIMLVAIINYVNLANASATTRVTEVITRKIAGARKRNLFARFLSESVIISFIAVSFGLVLSSILTGVVNRQQLTASPLDFYSLREQLILVVCGGILTGIIAGFWPALSLSAVSPLISNKLKVLSGAVSVRKWLMIIQFSVSAGLLISAIIISRQYSYMIRSSTGFDSDNILFLRMGRELKKNYEPLTRNLVNIPGISAVANARYGFIGGRNPYPNEMLCNGREFKMDAMSFNTDTGFMEMLGLHLIRGNSFSEHDNVKSKLIINETALKRTGSDGELNDIILLNKAHNIQWQVVGVVRDFNTRSMQYPVSPYIIYYTPGDADMDGLYIKLVKGAVTGEVTERIYNVCRELAPDDPVNIESLDDATAKLYREDVNKKNIFMCFSVLSILISCIGLYALAGFMLNKRSKEFGIRKVFGADEKTLSVMISTEFLKIIAGGFIIVLPLTWFVMNKWLQNFAFKTGLSWWIFLVSGVTIMAVAAISVFSEIRKAARCNPADIIRYE